MTAGLRLCGPASLRVYFAAAGVLVLLFFSVSRELAIILSPILPVYLLSINVRTFNFIYDFRLVYLLSISVWSFGKSLSLLRMGFGPSEQGGVSLNVYMAGMVLAPAIANLFEYSAYSDVGRRDAGRYVKARWLLLLAAMWCVSAGFVFFALVGSFDELSSFVVLHVFQGFALVFASALLLGVRSSGSAWGGALIVCIYIVTILTYSEGEANRTSLLLPFAVLTISLFYGSATAKTSILSARSVWLSFIGIPLLAFPLIIGDIQKQEGMQLIEVINLVEGGPKVIWDSLERSNYLPSERSAADYFESVSAILENGEEIPGGIFFQLASSVMPRIFFPDKGDTDLSLIMWGRGYLPQPLYYEMFLEPIIDSGVVGIVVYFFFFLVLMSLSWRSVVMHRDGVAGLYCRSVYLLNLVLLFMVIRGPVIFLVWYGAMPNALCYLLMIKNRGRRPRNRSNVRRPNLMYTSSRDDEKHTN